MRLTGDTIPNVEKANIILVTFSNFIFLKRQQEKRAPYQMIRAKNKQKPRTEQKLYFYIKSHVFLESLVGKCFAMKSSRVSILPPLFFGLANPSCSRFMAITSIVPSYV